jgi:outer membrane protein TolC
MKQPLKWIFILALTGMIPTGATAQKDTISLQDILSRALEENKQLKMARMQAKKAEYATRGVKSKLYPQIEAYGKMEDYLKLPVLIIPGEMLGAPGENVPVQFGTQYNVEAGARFRQLLYNQSYKTSLRLSKKMEQIHRLGVERTREEIFHEIGRLYYLSHATKGQIELLKKNIARLDTIYQLTEIQLNQEMIRQADLKKIQVKRNNLKVEMNGMKNLWERQVRTISYLAGISDTQQIAFSDQVLSQPVGASEAQNKSRHPQLQLQNHKTELQALRLKRQRQAYLPTLTAFGRFNYQAQRDELDMFQAGKDKWSRIAVLGVNLQVPIFNGFNRQAKIQQARVSLEQAETKESQIKEELKMQQLNAAEKYRQKKMDFTSQQSNVALAQDVYAVHKTQYHNGMISLTELLQAESELSNTQGKKLESLLQLRLAELKLLQSQGMLMSLLN